MPHVKRLKNQNTREPQAEGCPTCRSIDHKPAEEPYPCRRLPTLPVPRQLLAPCGECGAMVLRGETMEHGNVRWRIPALFPITGAPHDCATARAVKKEPKAHLWSLVAAGGGYTAWETATTP
jgi:hypothetical protein